MCFQYAQIQASLKKGSQLAEQNVGLHVSLLVFQQVLEPTSLCFAEHRCLIFCFVLFFFVLFLHKTVCPVASTNNNYG